MEKEHLLLALVDWNLPGSPGKCYLAACLETVKFEHLSQEMGGEGAHFGTFDKMYFMGHTKTSFFKKLFRVSL